MRHIGSQSPGSFEGLTIRKRDDPALIPLLPTLEDQVLPCPFTFWGTSNASISHAPSGWARYAAQPSVTPPLHQFVGQMQLWKKTCMDGSQATYMLISRHCLQSVMKGRLPGLAVAKRRFALVEHRGPGGNCTCTFHNEGHNSSTDHSQWSR